MKDTRNETVQRVDHHPDLARGMRTDLEIAVIVLTITGSTLTACVLAATTLLASYVLRTLGAGFLDRHRARSAQRKVLRDGLQDPDLSS
ncbi:hypothetical protein ACTMTF_42345 [Nonomuraea sp. ZG12]|uniref:hypothetical protein n=1 Tax=Nonomuraea sp. ZG12 TaxID=3452207 RepID=UPI003F89F22B